jgi:hypothetical protein
MIPSNKSEPKHLRIEGTSHEKPTKIARKRHEKPTKIARKRHKNPKSYKPGIDAIMKASIHSTVRFFTNGGKI